eukprot:211525_1
MNWRCGNCELLNNYKRIKCQACFNSSLWNYYESLNQFSWNIWGNIFMKIEYFQKVIHAIVTKHRIKYESIQTGFPGTHAVFLLDDKYIIKIYAPCQQLAHSFYLEFEIHSLLYNHNKLLQNYIPNIIVFDVLQINNNCIKYAILSNITDKHNAVCVREMNHFIATLNNDKQPQIDHITSVLSNLIKEIHSTSISNLFRKYPSWKDVTNINWKLYVEKHKYKIKKQLLEKTGDRKKENEIYSFFNLNERIKTQLIEYIDDEKNFQILNDEKLVLVHGDITEDHLYFKKNKMIKNNVYER